MAEASLVIVVGASEPETVSPLGEEVKSHAGDMLANPEHVRAVVERNFSQFAVPERDYPADLKGAQLSVAISRTSKS